MNCSQRISSIILCIFLGIGSQLYAQNTVPQLPDMVASSDKGINVLSWLCQYDGLASIAVQRSDDSIFNYVTIGFVKNLKKGVQAFIDGHPKPGDNWYRLYIAFGSDLTWYSNRIKIHIDSATLLEKGVLPPNEELQKYASSVNLTPGDVIANTKEKPEPVNTGYTKPTYNTNTNATTANNTNTTNTYTPPAKPKPNLKLNIPKEDNVNQMAYIKSRYVFTNPYTGHITLELPAETRKVYSIKFFKQNDTRNPVLEVPRLRKKEVIIDKHNFQTKGIYKFELFEGQWGTKIDEGYISIY